MSNRKRASHVGEMRLFSEMVTDFQASDTQEPWFIMSLFQIFPDFLSSSFYIGNFIYIACKSVVK